MRAPLANIAAMRITHLTLKNWRNFKQADFDLRERLVIVGPNASGKSNLLDALRFLKQIASPAGGFQDAVETRGGIPRLRCLAARNYNHGRVTIHISIGSDECPDEWSYEMTFTAEQRGRHRPVLTHEIVCNRGRPVLERPTPEDEDDPERMTQTHLEQVNANRDFREISEFLGSVRYLHLVPHLIREPERAGSVREDPYGSDLLLRMAKTPSSTRSHHLRRIGEGLRAAVPQIDRIELVQDEIGHWHLEARYEHWRPQPAIQDERLFSDGTLRMIGLLWSLLEGRKGRGPVLLEEPELSLHTSVVKQLPTVFNRVAAGGGPQILLTTHSNEILEDPGLGVDEVVLLTPGKEGTEALPATSVRDVHALLECGMSLAEILGPRTEPDEVTDLPRRLAGT